MSLRTSTPRLGTDGSPKPIPHLGDAATSHVESAPLQGARSHVALVAYALALGGLAVVVAVALTAAGA